MVGLESNKLVNYSINESVTKAKSYNDDYFRLASILGK
jgi:hypothetical protein